MAGMKGILKTGNKYDSISHNHLDYIREYRIWGCMINRCTNPKCDMYYCYGGRGIKVCDHWADKDVGFVNFYHDMGKRPIGKDGKPYQIDRIDCNGDYCPENCRWVTAKENSFNRRKTIKVSLFGDDMSLNEAIQLLHLKRTTVAENIRLRHMSPEDALVKGLRLKYKEAVSCVR